MECEFFTVLKMAVWSVPRSQGMYRCIVEPWEADSWG